MDELDDDVRARAASFPRPDQRPRRAVYTKRDAAARSPTRGPTRERGPLNEVDIPFPFISSFVAGTRVECGPRTKEHSHLTSATQTYITRTRKLFAEANCWLAHPPYCCPRLLSALASAAKSTRGGKLRLLRPRRCALPLRWRRKHIALAGSDGSCGGGGSRSGRCLAVERG